LTIDALVSNRSESTVRMGDGERMLYQYCKQSPGKTVCSPDSPLGNDWLESFCCKDIPTDLLRERIRIAAEECTWFAPQIMGMWRPAWAIAEVFATRDHYVDNWFVRQWTRPMQDQLLEAAGTVLLIHADGAVTSSITGRARTAEVISMNHWNQGDGVIERACQSTARLVLFAGGPANKYIAPKIAASGKVVLDLGQAMAKEWC
jgi:hypothetical protein